MDKVDDADDAGDADGAALWERHAGWWQEGFTGGADPEYEEQILPLAADCLAGARRVLDVGTGEGQVARLAIRLGAELVVGVDPTAAQIGEAARRAGGPAYLRATADALPLPDASVDAVVACLVFEHIRAVDAAIAEVGRVLEPGGRFTFFLNHPLLQTPSSGWIDDHVLDPPEQYWRIGSYLVEDETVEEVERGVFIPFIHRPLSRYVNAMAANGLFIERMEEPAPPPGFLARAAEYVDAATIPRLLLLVARRGGKWSPVSEFVVITGLSGAGRSEVADHLEDLGWFVIDNVPAPLIPKLGELAAAPGAPAERLALVVRTGDFEEEVDPALDALRQHGRVRILYLDATTDVLVRRFESTRRRHPLGDTESVVDAIERERVLLQPVKAQADVIVDTSELNVHQLRERIVDLFGADGHGEGLRTSVVSFGYKHGIPLDVDLVLDCRFLPNPHWVDELRPHTGLEDAVRDYVIGFPETQAFLERLDGLLAILLPAYVKEGKSYLSIALGCTGGHHRSVVIAEEVARILRRHGFTPTVIHRDIDK